MLCRYDDRTEANREVVDGLIEKGLKFYKDHILPGKIYRDPTETERSLFEELRRFLRTEEAAEMGEKELQALVFDIARGRDVDPKDFFSAIYQVLLGQARGPRFGSFAKLVGLDRVVALIDERIGEMKGA